MQTKDIQAANGESKVVIQTESCTRINARAVYGEICSVRDPVSQAVRLEATMCAGISGSTPGPAEVQAKGEIGVCLGVVKDPMSSMPSADLGIRAQAGYSTPGTEHTIELAATTQGLSIEINNCAGVKTGFEAVAGGADNFTGICDVRSFEAAQASTSEAPASAGTGGFSGLVCSAPSGVDSDPASAFEHAIAIPAGPDLSCHIDNSVSLDRPSIEHAAGGDDFGGHEAACHEPTGSSHEVSSLDGGSCHEAGGFEGSSSHDSGGFDGGSCHDGGGFDGGSCHESSGHDFGGGVCE